MLYLEFQKKEKSQKWDFSNFSVFRSLNCLDARTSAALVGRKIFDPKTMGKKVIERHTEKLLIYAAIRSIGKRG